ncbi:MAG: hypothetical protein WCG06_03845, partial [Candidatus Omnitrophota bacterium]
MAMEVIKDQLQAYLSANPNAQNGSVQITAKVTSGVDSLSDVVLTIPISQLNTPDTSPAYRYLKDRQDPYSGLVASFDATMQSPGLLDQAFLFDQAVTGKFFLDHGDLPAAAKIETFIVNTWDPTRGLKTDYNAKDPANGSVIEHIWNNLGPDASAGTFLFQYWKYANDPKALATALGIAKQLSTHLSALPAGGYQKGPIGSSRTERSTEENGRYLELVTSLLTETTLSSEDTAALRAIQQNLVNFLLHPLVYDTQSHLFLRGPSDPIGASDASLIAWRALVNALGYEETETRMGRTAIDFFSGYLAKYALPHPGNTVSLDDPSSIDGIGFTSAAQNVPGLSWIEVVGLLRDCSATAPVGTPLRIKLDAINAHLATLQQSYNIIDADINGVSLPYATMASQPEYPPESSPVTPPMFSSVSSTVFNDPEFNSNALAIPHLPKIVTVEVDVTGLVDRLSALTGVPVSPSNPFGVVLAEATVAPGYSNASTVALNTVPLEVTASDYGTLQSEAAKNLAAFRRLSVADQGYANQVYMLYEVNPAIVVSYSRADISALANYGVIGVGRRKIKTPAEHDRVNVVYAYAAKFVADYGNLSAADKALVDQGIKAAGIDLSVTGGGFGISDIAGFFSIYPATATQIIQRQADIDTIMQSPNFPAMVRLYGLENNTAGQKELAAGLVDKFNNGGYFSLNPGTYVTATQTGQMQRYFPDAVVDATDHASKLRLMVDDVVATTTVQDIQQEAIIENMIAGYPHLLGVNGITGQGADDREKTIDLCGGLAQEFRKQLVGGTSDLAVFLQKTADSIDTLIANVQAIEAALGPVDIA